MHCPGVCRQGTGPGPRKSSWKAAVPPDTHAERIYTAAGASDRLDRDIHPGAHEFSGRKAFEWFRRWL